MGIPFLFRLGWILLSVLVWFFFFYLASHKSEFPNFLDRYSLSYLTFLGSFLGLALIVTFSNLESIQKRIYPIRHVALLLSISFFLSVAIGEILVRILDPLGISYYEETSRYSLRKIPDPELIYKHMPLLRGTYQEVEVSINQLGLRDDPILPKKPGEFRILSIGDSVTFGWGVSKPQTFTSRIQNILSTTLSQPVRVINSGVGSYNSVQEYRWFSKVGISLEPDLVILLYVANDLEIKVSPFDPWSKRSIWDKSPPQALKIIAGKFWMYRLAKHTLKHVLLRKPYLPRNLESLSASSGWQASMKSVKSMAEICNNMGIPFVVFFFSWEDNEFTQKLVSDIRKAANPYPIKKVVEWFEGKQIRNFINSPVDSHPNSRGHEIMAEQMASFLIEQKFLPPKANAL